MIVVTVELRSAISRDRDKLLGIATISNTGVAPGGDPRYCVYKVVLSKMAPRERQAWKAGIAGIEKSIADAVDASPGDTEFLDGVVERFNRVSRGPWDLLYQALRAIVSERNP